MQRCNFEFRRHLWEDDLKFLFGLSSDIIREVQAGFLMKNVYVYIYIYLVLLFGAFKCDAIVEKVVLWSITKSSKSFISKPFYVCTNAEILADFQNSHGHCMLKYWEVILFLVFCYSDTEIILYSASLKSQRQGLSDYVQQQLWMTGFSSLWEELQLKDSKIYWG